MKTQQTTRHVLVLLVGASLAFAAERVQPLSDPDGQPDGTSRREMRDQATGNTLHFTPAETTRAGPELTRGDQRFFEKISRLNEREIALSKVAAQRATTPQVRSLAEEMISEHSEAGRELGALATTRGARLQTVSARDLKKDNTDKTGIDFDKAYLDKLIDLHEDTIDVLEDGAKSKDTEIADAAQKLLPKVKSHLERAKSLEKALD